MLLEMAMKEFELDCKVRKLSERTIKNYAMILKLFRQFMERERGSSMLEKITGKDVKLFLLNAEERGRKPQYINDLLKVLKVFFKYHEDEGTIMKNPTDRIHNVKQPKVLIRTFNEDDIRGMIGYFNGRDFLSIRNRTLMALLFDTGIHSVFLLVVDRVYRQKKKRHRLATMPPVDFFSCPVYNVAVNMFPFFTGKEILI